MKIKREVAEDIRILLPDIVNNSDVYAELYPTEWPDDGYIEISEKKIINIMRHLRQRNKYMGDVLQSLFLVTSQGE